LISKVSTSLIFANKAGVKEIQFEDPNLREATKPNDIGVSLFADIIIPANCNNDVLCEFVQKRFKAGQHLKLNGIFDKSGIDLNVQFDGELAIDAAQKYKIKKLGFAIVANFKGAPEVNLYGEMEVNFQNAGPVTFKAKLGLTVGGKVSLMLEMVGRLDKAFKIEGLSLENWKMEASINVISALPEFRLSGKIRVGTSSTPVETALAGGFESTTGKIYVYGEFKHWTIQKTLEAFNVDKTKIANVPRQILATGFPTAAAGLSLPTSTKLPNLNINLEAGFFFKGEINLLGNNVQCEISIMLPKITVKAKFQKISLASGMIEVTSVDLKEGPEFKLEIGPSSFILLIDANVDVLGLSIGAKINISPNGFKFDMTGRFLNMFQLTISLSAPFREDITKVEAKEWKINGCFDTTVQGDILKNAQEDVKSTSKDADQAEKDEKELGILGKLFEKAQKKVDKYKTDIQKYEAALKLEVSESERKAQKYIKQYGTIDCVNYCRKPDMMIKVGHLKMVACPGEPSLICPTFSADGPKALDPMCISKCNQKSFSYAKGVFRGAKGKFAEGKLEFFTEVLLKLQKYLIITKKFYDRANRAGGLISQIKEKAKKIKDAANNVKNWVKDKVLNIETLCLNSQLTPNSICFSVDAKLTVLQKPMTLNNEEVCLSKQGMIKFAENILKKVFPDYEGIKEKAMQIKDLLKQSKDDDIKKVEKELEQAEKAKRTIEESSEEDGYVKGMTGVPEYTMRNDDSIIAFRQIFFRNNDEEEDEGSASGEDSANAQATTSTTSPIDIDSAALSSSDDICRRSKAVEKLYEGVSDSLNALLKNNKEAKAGYENFTQSWMKALDSEEHETRATAQMMNMTESDTSDMLFYTNYGREGIENWKKQYAAKFDVLDKQSLKIWQSYMSRKVTEKNLDMASFINMVNQATAEVSKKWEVPGKTNEMQTNMNSAEQMMQTLLNADQQGFMSNEESITKLANFVQILKTLNGSCQKTDMS